MNNDGFTAGMVFVVFFAALSWASWSLSAYRTEGVVMKHCSLTGTYVIDNDTVLACRVIKRNTDEAEPSEPKEEEQSL